MLIPLGGSNVAVEIRSDGQSWLGEVCWAWCLGHGLAIAGALWTSHEEGFDLGTYESGWNPKDGPHPRAQEVSIHG